MRRGCVLGIVSMVLLLACASDDRPPFGAAGAGGGLGGGLGGAAGDGGEPARRAEAGAADASDADADAAGPTCRCTCHLEIRTAAAIFTTDLPCETGFCMSHQIHRCSARCVLTVEKC